MFFILDLLFWGAFFIDSMRSFTKLLYHTIKILSTQVCFENILARICWHSLVIRAPCSIASVHLPHSARNVGHRFGTSAYQSFVPCSPTPFYKVCGCDKALPAKKEKNTARVCFLFWLREWDLKSRDGYLLFVGRTRRITQYVAVCERQA